MGKRVLIFGATGMIGQGVLLECVRSREIDEIVAVGRSAVKRDSPKVRSLVHKDMWEYESLRPQLQGFDACYFCLGVTSNGMKEDEYTRITYDIPLAAATVLVDLNPQMTFVFVSAVGAERGSSLMWSRVKARAEDDLMKLPFKAVYVVRPAFIEPLDGIRSRTKLYDILYSFMWPLIPLIRILFAKNSSTTRALGQTMIQLTTRGDDKTLLFSSDFNRLAAQASSL